MMENKKIDAKKCAILGACLIAAYAAVFSFICVRKYMTFGYHDQDLAIYTNILWNLVHGNHYSSFLGKHFLSDHASFIIFLTAVPYSIFCHPAFLLILSSFSIAASAVPVYLIARDEIDDISAVLCTLLYLCYPALHYANLYEFNFETLSLPFLSFAFYFLLKNRKAQFILMCILASSCKENVTLTVAALGLFGMLRPHRRLIGLCAVSIGMAWFLFDIYFLPALMQKTQVTQAAVPYIGLFSKYGTSPAGVITHLFSHPADIVKTVFAGQEKLGFFNGVFGVLLYIPLLRPDILLINIPHILLRMLSSDRNEQTIFFHAAAPLASFVFFAFIFSIKSLLKKAGRAIGYKHAILLVILTFEISSMLFILNTRMILTGPPEQGYENAARRDLLRIIPRQAGVAAEFRFLPRLASRENLYSLEAYFGGRRGRGPRSLPESVDYVLIDANDTMMPLFFESQGLLDRELIPYLVKNHFGLVEARGDMLLFKKGYTGRDRLFEIKRGDPEIGRQAIAATADGLSLLGVGSRHIQGGGAIQLIFSWHKEGERTPNYMMQIFIERNGSVMAYSNHMPGYSLYPPSAWEKTDVVKECYWLIDPKLKKGKYSLVVSFFDLNTGRAGAEYPLGDIDL